MAFSGVAWYAVEDLIAEIRFVLSPSPSPFLPRTPTRR